MTIVVGLNLASQILHRRTRCDDDRVVGFDQTHGTLGDGRFLGGILMLLDVDVAVVDVGADFNSLAVCAV